MKKWLNTLLAMILIVLVVALTGVTLLTRSEGYKLVTCETPVDDTAV